MQFYGPYAPQVSTPGLWQINANAERLLVENDSIYDLYLFFGPDSPAARGGANVQGSYNIRVHAFKDAIIQIQRLGQGWGQNIFDGRVYYLAILGNAQNLSGLFTTVNNVGLTSLDPGEIIDQSMGFPKQYYLQGQPRIQSLPIAYDRGGFAGQAGTHNDGTFTPAATGSTVDLFNIAGTFTTPTTLYALAIYDIFIAPESPVPRDVLDFSIQIDVRNAGNTSVGAPWPKTFCRGQIAWEMSSSPQEIQWSLPPSLLVRYMGIVGVISADHLTVMVRSNQTTSPPLCLYDIGYSLPPGVSALPGSTPLPGVYGLSTSPTLY